MGPVGLGVVLLVGLRRPHCNNQEALLQKPLHRSTRDGTGRGGAGRAGPGRGGTGRDGTGRAGPGRGIYMYVTIYIYICIYRYIYV